MRTTDELEHLTTNLCKDDKQVNIIRQVLHDTLASFQWYYQVTNDDQQYRNANNGTRLAVNKVVALLKNQGEHSLAEQVEEVLYEDPKNSVLIRSKVLSQAKDYMKEQLLANGMDKSVYNNDFAVSLENAFIEWCEEYPLDAAPEHFDNDFEPPIY